MGDLLNKNRIIVHKLNQTELHISTYKNSDNSRIHNIVFFRMLQQDCPNGRLTPAKFVDMYKMFFPSGNAEEFCDHVFRTFDMDKNGYIDFKVSIAWGFFYCAKQTAVMKRVMTTVLLQRWIFQRYTLRDILVDHSAWLNTIVDKIRAELTRGNALDAAILPSRKEDRTFYDVEISLAWI